MSSSIFQTHKILPLIIISPQIFSNVTFYSYTRKSQFAFHYRTISPSGGSQILRLFLLLDLLPHLFNLFFRRESARILGILTLSNTNIITHIISLFLYRDRIQDFRNTEPLYLYKGNYTIIILPIYSLKMFYSFDVLYSCGCITLSIYFTTISKSRLAPEFPTQLLSYNERGKPIGGHSLIKFVFNSLYIYFVSD